MWRRVLKRNNGKLEGGWCPEVGREGYGISLKLHFGFTLGVGLLGEGIISSFVFCICSCYFSRWLIFDRGR